MIARDVKFVIAVENISLKETYFAYFLLY